MVVSVHVADVGARGPLMRAPKPSQVAGLRHANVGLCAALGNVPPRVNPGRVAMVAFWDNEDALDAFSTTNPMADRLSSGWHARLEPLRAFGAWPGLDDDVSRKRAVVSEGPVVVTTLGRLRLTQTVRFLRASARAESRVLKAPGLLWATGVAGPPFVATISIWETAQAAADYAYGGPEAPEHPGAIDADRSKPFHHRNAFIRYRPMTATGTLDGGNPLPALDLI